MFQKAFFTPYIYILLLCTVFHPLKAQKIRLTISPTDSISKSVLKEVPYDSLFNNTAAIEQQLDSINLALNAKGYINPLFELTFKNELTANYFFTAGKSYPSITLYFNDALPLSLQNKLGVKSNSVDISIDTLEAVLKSIVNQYDLIGFPFTTVQLRNQAVMENNLVATVEINTNKPRTIDKIIIEGYQGFPKAHLKHQTPLKIGGVYSQQKIIKTSAYLNNLSFVSELKTPEVLFTTDSTHIYLYLQKKKAHQFEGLVGFNSSEKSSKLKLFGYVNVNFNNLLNKGEQFSVQWNNSGSSKSSFLLETYFPFIVKSPLSFNGSFELHKQDSTYTTTLVNTGLSYRINAHQLKGVVQFHNSTVLTASNTLQVAEFKKKLIGIAYEYELINPDRFFKTELATHIKVLTGNRSTEGVTNTQQQVELLLNYTFKLNSRNYVFAQNQTKKIIGSELYYNELFQIGGANTLRGFNEKQLLGSAYSILNLEYRYLTSDDSFLYSITDIGLVKNPYQLKKELLTGLGLGYSFKISTGFLSLSYAVGKFETTSFDFKKAKMHLTWIQTF